MKSISIDKNIEVAGKELSYKEILRMICESSGSSKGITVPELLKRARIFEQLNNLTEESTVLELEDADYTHLKTLVEEFPFSFANESLIEFVETVRNPQ